MHRKENSDSQSNATIKQFDKYQSGLCFRGHDAELLLGWYSH